MEDGKEAIQTMIFKTKPIKHQKQAFDMSKDRDSFALLLEQGLGKTKVALDVAAYKYIKGEIDTLIIIAPNGVHLTWTRFQVPEHLPPLANDPVQPLCFEWISSKAGNKSFKEQFMIADRHAGLLIATFNVEAFSTDKAKAAKALQRLLRDRTCMLVVDESSRIKTPKTARTKTILKLAKQAKVRWIMTGTAITQSPFDVFTQYEVLQTRALGFSSYYAFKNNYGVFETSIARKGKKQWVYKTLLHYVRLDDLAERMKPYSFRRTKKQCLKDLPEKIYQTIHVPLAIEQKKLYDTMEEEGIAKVFDGVNDLTMLSPQQMVRAIRCQQMLGGFLPWTELDEDGEITKREIIPLFKDPMQNPRFAMLFETLENCNGGIIIWARFRPEIEMIVNKLKEVYGKETVVELHGGISGNDRIKSLEQFQDKKSAVRFIVGQQASGIGVTLTEAEYAIYYSNAFSSEQRLQTEDRCHRIGLKHNVTYIDLVAIDTIDERIREVLTYSLKNATRVMDKLEKDGM